PRSEAYFVFPLAQGTPGKQCGLAATGDYQPSLRSPWLAATVIGPNFLVPGRFQFMQFLFKILIESMQYPAQRRVAAFTQLFQTLPKLCLSDGCWSDAGHGAYLLQQRLLRGAGCLLCSGTFVFLVILTSKPCSTSSA
ncbi:hypothetical protein, partial [Thiolapillus sp.]|uniref:hypothetical protein n=2 Tax=Thiolapillus sp. TaxID=2017437 RepID=UPI003AF623CD